MENDVVFGLIGATHNQLSKAISVDSVNVSGVSTLGIITVTDLTGQQLNVSGVLHSKVMCILVMMIRLYWVMEAMQIYHDGANSYIQDGGTGGIKETCW